MNAALCGAFGCPIALVTGDASTCPQTADLLGDQMLQVAVKEGIGALSGVMIPPRRARRLIEDGARESMSRVAAATALGPWQARLHREVLFQNTRPFTDFRWRPGVEVTGKPPICVSGRDWSMAWRSFVEVSVPAPGRGLRPSAPPPPGGRPCRSRRRRRAACAAASRTRA